MSIPKYSLLGVLFLAFATTGCLSSQPTSTDEAMMTPGTFSPGVSMAGQSGSATNDANDKRTSTMNINNSGESAVIDLTSRGIKTTTNLANSGNDARITASNSDPVEVVNTSFSQASEGFSVQSQAAEIADDAMRDQIEAGAVSSSLAVTNTVAGVTETVRLVEFDREKAAKTGGVYRIKNRAGFEDQSKTLLGVQMHMLPVRTAVEGGNAAITKKEVEYATFTSGTMLWNCKNAPNNFLYCYVEMPTRENMGGLKDLYSLDRFQVGVMEDTGNPIYGGFFYYSDMIVSAAGLDITPAEVPYLDAQDRLDREMSIYEAEVGVASTGATVVNPEDGKSDPVVIDQR